MNIPNKLLLLGALGLALAGRSAFAQSDPADPAPPGPPPGPPPGHHLGQVITNLLDKYDVNKDGILDQNEIAALKQDIADGKLAPPPGALPPGGRPGKGRPGGPPPMLDAKQVLLKFDANKDGVLDETELAAFLKDLAAHRPPPPPGFGGPGGPPPGNGPPDGATPPAPPQQ